MDSVSDGIARVRDRIALAAAQAGRDAGRIALMAVSKTQSREKIDEAIAEGQTLFGENRVQEAAEKWADSPDGVRLHLIGRLQSNKAKLIAGLFDAVESVDSLRIAEAISRRASAADLSISLFMQFDCSGEDTKSGYTDADLLLDDAQAIAAMPGVDVRGLMTIGPNTTDEVRIGSAFDRTRQLHDRLSGVDGLSQPLTLSMGMSADFELAIRCGSTEVRIGSAIFGART